MLAFMVLWSVEHWAFSDFCVEVTNKSDVFHPEVFVEYNG